jgi:hypothetical protein
VRIIGAWFPEPVDLADGRLDRQLWLEKCRFEGAADLHGLHIDGLLSLEASAFAGQGDDLVSVNLLAARVGGQLAMDGATVAGRLVMNGLEVGDLFMRTGAFQDVDLDAASVGRWLVMDDATVAGRLDMNGLEVGNLLMRTAAFHSRVDLPAVNAKRLDISGAELAGLDLRGAKIDELRLATPDRLPQWRDKARLILRGARIVLLEDAWGSLQHRSAWPEHIDIVGFKYGDLQGVRDAGGQYTGLDSRPLDWFEEWLMLQQPYSPEPYTSLGTYLRSIGNFEKANAILYEGRVRERKVSFESRAFARWLGLALLDWTIGYGLGLGYFRVLGWILVFTLVGTVALYASRQGPESLSAKAIFSLDRLLPVVQLDEAHKEVEAARAGGVKYYFYAHKLVGWVLASFLIAALAGLTQV